MQRASFTNYCETHASIFSHVSLKLQLRCCRTSQLQWQQWQLQHLFCSSSFTFFAVASRSSSASSLVVIIVNSPRIASPSLRLSVCASVLLSCLLSACLAIFQLLTASSGLMSAVNDNNYNNNNNSSISKNNNSSLIGTVCSCCARTCNLLGY